MRGILSVITFTALFCSSAHAEKLIKSFGAWSVIRSSDGADLIAVTSNESYGFIAYRCFSSTQNCAHVISINTKCEDGKDYPILVNSDYSALSMNTICSENNGNYELLLTEWDSIHGILRGGNNIGFAVPMENGLFKVSRFSLNGSDKAIDYVTSMTQRLKKGDSYM